jgi:hypothetical protein
MITENEQDELIFDFLEGNLSPDEEEAFLIMKEESELFNRQVRLWQNTYLEEALPSVELLEKKLFIKPGSDTVNFSSRLYIILIILLTYATLSGDSTHHNVPHTVVKVVQNNSIAGETAGKDLNLIVGCTEVRKIVARRTIELKSETPIENSQPAYQPFILFERKPEVSFKTEQPTLRKIEIRKNGDQKTTTVVARKKWTRQEMRRIRQKLWQDNHTRNANKFLKGKVPYVVPLNSNNF